MFAAIDSSQVPVKAPEMNHEDYYNHRHFYSDVLQAVVDSSGLYLAASTGYPGSMHDLRVLRMSNLFREAEDGDILRQPTLNLNGTVICPLIVSGQINK